MISTDKSREKLFKELQTLRKRIVELEALENERNQAHLRMADSERRYRLVAENLTDVIWIVNIDSPTQLNYISPSVRQLLGYTVEESMNKTMKEVFTPASFRVAMKALAEEKTSEQKEHIDQHRSRTLELDLMRKDGSVVPVEVNFTFIRGEDGLPVEILAVARDITERKRAEKQLRQSETKYSTLVEKGNDGVIIIQDGLIRFANSRVTDITGFPPAEVIDRSFIDFVSPEYRAVVADNYEKRIGGESAPGKYEIEILSKEGKSVPVEVRASAIEYEERPADMAVIRNITERRLAEKQLRFSDAAFRSLRESIVAVDLEYTITHWNEISEQLYGVKASEAIGKGLLDVLDIAEAWPGETAERFKRLEAQGFYHEEQLHRTKSKEVWVDVSVQAIKDNGKRYGWVALATDISDRKKMETQITHAANEWRTTFDSITDLVSIIDSDFKLVRVNRAFADTFGKRPKELVGRLCYEVMHKANEPIADCPHRKTLRTKKPTTVEFYEPTLGIYLEATTAPISNEKGEIMGCVQVARDVTERNRMQEQLMLTDRLASIGELASGVAHELNNPLTTVIGFSQLLMQRDITDDMKEDLELVNSEAQRCTSIVKNLLTFARKHAPVKQLSQINNIIEDVLRLRAYEHKVSNIEVERRLAADLPEVLVDYFQMQQVFLNIIINAEFFMAQAHNRGRLTIVTEKLDSILRVSFADDGPGISEENLNRLFTPFFTTKEVGKGTGLGLSICHGIVAEHNGRIYAKSRLGKGATFVVELPF